MTILVTGASGQLGSIVVDALLARGIAPSELIAAARDTSKLVRFTELGVRTATLDYDRPETIAGALDGVERMLLVSGSEVGRRVPQHRAVIEAAVAAGVAQLVYTSAPFANTSELVLAPEHRETEAALAASGLPAVVLRNNWYNENYLGQARQAAESGVLAAGVGDGRVASAARADYAEAAAVVLSDGGHLGEVYELAGDVAWNFAEFAAIVSELSGRNVEFRSLSTEEQLAQLTAAGLEAGTAQFVAALDANIRAGALASTDGTLSRLIGHPTTPLAETLRAALGG